MSNPMSDEEPTRTQRSIRSVEVGGRLLMALAEHGRPMALKELAQAAGMLGSNAHPYLVSFGKLGLIEQDTATGKYGLGRLAMQLGLISLQQFDPVRLATPSVYELALMTRHTVALAVWGNRGPTIVRIEEAPTPVHVNMRHGTVMSMRGTATGRLFAAYLPRSTMLGALQDEYAHALRIGETPSARSCDIDPEFELELQLVRQHGLSRTLGGAVTGINALSAPVFDGTGTIVLGLTAIGPAATLNADFDGPVSRALLDRAEELSKQLRAPKPSYR